MLRPTRKDISNALLAWYDITFDEHSEMVEAYYTIIHDETHPIDPRSKHLEQDIRRNVSSFCDGIRRNLEGTARSRQMTCIISLHILKAYTLQEMTL